MLIRTTPRHGRTPGGLRRAGSALALGAVLAGVLSACAQDPGAAAVADGRQVSHAELTEAVQQMEQIAPAAFAQGGLDRNGILLRIVLAPYFERTAADSGEGVSDGEARALAEQIATESGTTVPGELGEGTLDVLRLSVAASKLEQRPDGPDLLAEVQESVASADIEVNPRYGTYDPRGAVLPTDAPWVAGGAQG